MKVWKIIKVNFLSVLALPLLAVSAVVKLLSKAFERFGLLLGMAYLAMILVGVVVSIIYEEQFDSTAQMVFRILSLVGGGILGAALMRYLLYPIFGGIGLAVIGVLEGVYDFLYGCYLGLANPCGGDVSFLSHELGKVKAYAFCPIYSLLRGGYWLIVGFVTIARPLSFGLGALLIWGTFYRLNWYARTVFGMKLTELFTKMEKGELVLGILSYFMFAVIIVSCLYTLGQQWCQWGEELREDSI